jgi:hypothetical protein
VGRVCHQGQSDVPVSHTVDPAVIHTQVVLHVSGALMVQIMNVTLAGRHRLALHDSPLDGISTSVSHCGKMEQSFPKIIPPRHKETGSSSRGMSLPLAGGMRLAKSSEKGRLKWKSHASAETL